MAEQEEGRLKLISSFITRPETTAYTFYTKKGGRFFSPYLDIDNPSLCCILQERRDCPHDYQVKIVELSSPFVKYFAQGGREIKRFKPFLGRCGFPNILSNSAIGSDEFTNEVIISYLLDYLNAPARELGLDNILFTYTATVCGNKGLILRERGGVPLSAQSLVFQPYQERGFTRVGEIPVFREDFILNTLGQVVIVLTHLHSWNFVHARLTLENVLFFSQPYTYYPNDFTVKIANFNHSSLTYQGVRFFNYSSLANAYLSINPFKPLLKEREKELYFRLDHFTISQIVNEAEHDKFPYYSAYDIYVFIISMFLNPSFFFSLARFPEIINRIWNVAFDEEESVLLYQRLYDLQGRVDPNSLEIILGVIKDVPLKCNILHLLYESIFAIKIL